MALKILMRLFFIVFVAGFSVNVYSRAVPEQDWTFSVAAIYAVIAALVALALVIYEWRWQPYIVREVVAVIFGLAAGLFFAVLLFLIAVAFFLPSQGHLDAAFRHLQPTLPLLVAGCCYVAVTVVLQTKDDFRFLLPYIDFSRRGTQEGGMLLDTSAIIDGRIVEIAETGLVTAPLVIPDFVLREVQTLADQGDRQKRQRGRRGLDMVAKLQRLENVRVVVRPTDVPPQAPVDPELVRLAKEIHGRILTTDFNLNKVSQIEGLLVVNVNDLANAVKPSVLPGDALSIKIIRAGQEEGQGVGYLEDGTMVVVESARRRIGETLPIRVTGSIQTSAGRMIFGQIAEEREAADSSAPSEQA